MYPKARRFHRALVIVITLLSLLMMVTGATMKYPSLLTFINPLSARQVHHTISSLFSLTLTLMAGSGLTLYFYPIIQKRRRQASPPTTSPTS